MSDEPGRPGPSKKKKIYNFNREWEEEFLFRSVNEKAICLLCNASVAVPKRSNVIIKVSMQISKVDIYVHII